MADSWDDLGTNTNKFLIGGDWNKGPSQSLEPYRTIIQYPGTGIKIRDITNSVKNQIKFTIHFGNINKAAEYALLTAFYTYRGRATGFWVPLPKIYWTLRLDTTMEDPTNLAIADTCFQWFLGKERMYLYLSDGSYISRQITDLTYAFGGHEVMTVNTALDRIIKVSDVGIFGKLLFCRFDQDEIEFQYTTTALSDCDIDFIELPMEYPV